MPKYSFKETILYFSDKIGKRPPQEDLDEEEVEIDIDQFSVIISPGKLEGSLWMETLLGLYVTPFNEERLKELATSNFLNINTGGCSLVMDEVSISLKCLTSPATPPQENWEWMHRIVSVAREWQKVLSMWDEFVLLGKEK